jgi:hypothetical protein
MNTSGDSFLVISGDGMPPYSTRFVTQTLEPDDVLQFDKYQSTISCSDVDAPAFDQLQVGNWRRTVNGGLVDLSGRGSTLTVDCVNELCFKTAGGTAQRAIVPGSERVGGDYTFYRPRITFGLVGKSQETNELEDTVSWQLQLKEI